ncbi:MAG: helix-turn-helix transcriptional regulator [Pseudomonadota bacterium]
MANHHELKNWRKAKGWTQSEAADYFSVRKMTYWRWERRGLPRQGAARELVERELEAFRAEQDAA